MVAISYFFVLQNTPDRTVRAYVGVLALYPSLFLFPLVSIGFGLVVVSAISPKSFLYNLRSRSLGWKSLVWIGMRPGGISSIILRSRSP